jgi:hypothetical protein
MTTITPSFQTALEYIQFTNTSLFLTGKAGTGKTTFLKYVKTHVAKRMAVVAPTGVAAINAGGVTIHSFFQLPFTPFIPAAKGFNNTQVVDKNSLIGNIKLTGTRKAVIQKLELLIIDEISMVRADVLDAMDTLLKHVRNNYNAPFGGVQLLMIGDMFQLPPVIKEEEWQWLAPYYNSAYFFDSKICEQHMPACISLYTIFRQKDTTFIELLNQVRHNNISANTQLLLDKLYNPNIEVNDNTNTITLCTHNYKADALNAKALQDLTTPILRFVAKITGEFYEKMYPADEVLELKIGAKVMFIKNDVGEQRRYFNGKIGTVIDVTDDTIMVKCEGDADAIRVQHEVWNNIKYNVSANQAGIEEEIIGSFTQYPLRLAWAITIHKSQGLTFEKAIIDAGEAFAPGQVYVALSRCTNMEGIILKSAIRKNNLISDPRIVEFENYLQPEEQQAASLTLAKAQYERDCLIQLFESTPIIQELAKCNKLMQENKAHVPPETQQWAVQLYNEAYEIEKINEKFIDFLLKAFASPTPIVENEALQQKLKNACSFYHEKYLNLITSMKKVPISIESKPVAKALQIPFHKAYEIAHEYICYIDSLQEGYTLSHLLFAKANYIPPKTLPALYAVKNTTHNEHVEHAELFELLIDERDAICETKNLPIYRVASKQTLLEMITYLPFTEKDLLKITGFGEAKVKQFGGEFLTIIKQYCLKHSISSNIHEIQRKALDEKPVKEKKVSSNVAKESKGNSKEFTLSMFQEGKTIVQIAQERNLATSTVEGHLAQCISIGSLAVHTVLEPYKITIIENALQQTKEEGLTEVKTLLGNAYSYADIRYVKNHLRWQELQQSNNAE